jgi:peroxiredoxin
MGREKRGIIYSGGIAFVCISLFTIWNFIWKRNEVKHMDLQTKRVERPTFFFSEEKMPVFRLEDLEGNLIIFNDSNLKERNLFVFFSPLDCSSCLKEAIYWQLLYDRNLPNVAVLGIVQNSNLNQLHRFRSTYYLTFPILVDVDGLLFKELSISHTPLKLVVDKSRAILKADQSVFGSYGELFDFLM